MEPPKPTEPSDKPVNEEKNAEGGEVLTESLERNSTKPPKRKMETGLILGVIALVINIITVSVYGDQWTCKGLIIVDGECQ